LCHCAINIQENSLGNVFRFTRIPHNLQGNAKDQLLVPIEENCERVALSLLEADHEALVGQTLQLRRRHRLWMRNSWVDGIQKKARFTVQNHNGVEVYNQTTSKMKFC
jgi:RNase adaptor protein for sRNA GlmZ degradation